MVQMYLNLFMSSQTIIVNISYKISQIIYNSLLPQFFRQNLVSTYIIPKIQGF